MSVVGRIVSFIIMTFFIAALYGVGCAAMDYLGDQPDSVVTGRYAAAHVYGLFGSVSEEASINNADKKQPSSPSLARKIAAPYAVTADISGLLSSKLINGMSSVFHTVDKKTEEEKQRPTS